MRGGVPNVRYVLDNQSIGRDHSGSEKKERRKIFHDGKKRMNKINIKWYLLDYKNREVRNDVGVMLRPSWATHPSCGKEIERRMLKCNRCSYTPFLC